jgi:hypothetical protein
LTWSNKFCGGPGEAKRKRQGPMAEKYYYNKVLMNFLGKREDKDKRRQEMMKLELFFKTVLSEHILKK